MNSVGCRPELQGVVNCVSSPGDDTEFDGASLTGPQPYEGERETVVSVSRVPSECGLEPRRSHDRNPVAGFHAVYGVEEVNKMV